MSGGVPGYAELEFDLPRALLQTLVSTLDRVERVSLLPGNAAILPEQQGVYQLFLDDVAVYVGKTDAQAGLMSRLVRHCRKVQHRLNLDPARVSFKAIRVYVFTAVDIEGDLIRHYGGGKALPWNNSGFGSNDPGRERDTTKNKPANFDYQHPADIDRVVEFELPQRCTAADALKVIRRKVPYTVRAQKPKRNSPVLHPDLEGQLVDCQVTPMSLRTAISELVKQLPEGWQATKLLGYVILYKEARDTYPDAEIIARS